MKYLYIAATLVISSVKICAQENFSGEVTGQDGKRLVMYTSSSKIKKENIKQLLIRGKLYCDRNSARIISY